MAAVQCSWVVEHLTSAAEGSSQAIARPCLRHAEGNKALPFSLDCFPVPLSFSISIWHVCPMGGQRIQQAWGRSRSADSDRLRVAVKLLGDEPDLLHQLWHFILLAIHQSLIFSLLQSLYTRDPHELAMSCKSDMYLNDMSCTSKSNKRPVALLKPSLTSASGPEGTSKVASSSSSVSCGTRASVCWAGFKNFTQQSRGHSEVFMWARSFWFSVSESLTANFLRMQTPASTRQVSSFCFKFKDSTIRTIDWKWILKFKFKGKKVHWNSLPFSCLQNKQARRPESCNTSFSVSIQPWICCLGWRTYSQLESQRHHLHQPRNFVSQSACTHWIWTLDCGLLCHRNQPGQLGILVADNLSAELQLQMLQSGF